MADFAHLTDDPEEHAILDELASVAAEIQSDKVCDDLTEYDRTVTVQLPADAAVIHGMLYIEIPIRNILTWLAMHDPSEKARILALRDDFYSGDSDDDYFHQIPAYGSPLITAEDRALARAARAKGYAERDAKRAAIIDEIEAEDRLKREVWLPFSAERTLMEAEREAHGQRADVLDAEWDRVVRGSEFNKSGGADYKVPNRAELQSMGEALYDDQEAWADRWAALREKVWDGHSTCEGASSDD